MKIVGGSTRSRLKLSIAAGCGVALLIMGITGAAAYAGDAETPAASAGDSYVALRPASSASESSTLSKTETVEVPLAPGPDTAPSVTAQGNALPPATTQIPQAIPTASSGEVTLSNGQIVNYEQSQNPDMDDLQIGSLREFMAEGNQTSPLGIELREARRKLSNGEEADGLLIVSVVNGSPAAKAGLRASQHTVHDILQGVAVAGALVFAPAVLAVPLVDQIHVGESYDMIIGVDGSRVTNFLDFEDRLRDMQPGEIVYLSIVRNGQRMQVPVNVPLTAPPWTF